MSEAGFRILPHTADVMIEAWAPTRLGCFEQAARAFVATFIDVSQAVAAERVTTVVDAASDHEMLTGLMDEIVFLIDVSGRVPVRTELTDSGNGGLVAMFDAAALDSVEIVGPMPKGVSLDATFEPRGEGWHCGVLIDV